MTTDLRDLDAAGVLAATGSTLRERRLAQVREMELLSAWAALHASDPTQGPDGALQRRVGNVLEQVGGEGTPPVQAFCLGEIAMARDAGDTATKNLLADVLDLQHRMPLTWAQCQTGEVEVYPARKAARLSRHLPLAKMWVVDQAVAAVIATESPGKTIDVAEAKVIEADPELHDRRVAEEKARRFFATGRRDEAGMKMVYARVEAGDALACEAMVTRVAQIIAPQHETKSYDEIRAIAFGIVVRPAECIQLLLEHGLTDPTVTEPEREPGDEVVAEADYPFHRAPQVDNLIADPDAHAEPPAHLEPDLEPDPVDEPVETRASCTPAAEDEPAPCLVEPPAEEPAPEPEEPHVPRAFAFPADLLDALRGLDATKLRPTATLYVHLHESSLDGRNAVARVEGLGPVSLEQLQALLGHHHVTVKPVIDLSERVRSTAYEHPESLKERIHLITGGDYWPYSTSTSRRVDHDHPTPYDHAAAAEPDPPKQTGTHNCGPLTRRHHVWKTHGGYKAVQSGDGRYVITTPHGLAFERDHRGTRRMDPDKATFIQTYPGIEVHLPDIEVTVDLPPPEV